MTFLKTLFCAALLGTAPPALSATITVGGDAEMNCGWTLDGPIETGDAAKIEQTIPSDWYLEERLCLDSPGGSFPEAVKILTLFQRNGIGTAVASGARCESACAIAFMGGGMTGEALVTETHRVLHPQGILGFHAPSLDVPEGTSHPAPVDQSFSVALKAISTLIEAGNTTDLNFSSRLLVTMLETRPDNMMYVDTVGTAAAWQIAVAPVALPQIPLHELAAHACWNGFFVGGVPPEYDANLPTTPAFVERKTVSDSSVELITAQGYDDEAVSRCLLRMQGKEDRFSPPAFGGVGFGDTDSARWATLQAFMTWPSSTQLSRLQIVTSNSDAFGEMQRIVRNAPDPTPIDLFQSCTLRGQNAAIVNVQNYVNLRRTASLKAGIVREVPFGEKVTITGKPVVGREWAGQSERCVDLCNRWARNQRDAALSRDAAQCVADNVIWYPIRDARGNAGYVSRKYLQ